MATIHVTTHCPDEMCGQPLRFVAPTTPGTPETRQAAMVCVGCRKAFTLTVHLVALARPHARRLGIRPDHYG